MAAGEEYVGNLGLDLEGREGGCFEDPDFGDLEPDLEDQESYCHEHRWTKREFTA